MCTDVFWDVHRCDVVWNRLSCYQIDNSQVNLNQSIQTKLCNKAEMSEHANSVTFAFY